jgi:dephospho-CoA kinase
MVIGITGNFGVGKTTVANMFRRLGAEVVEADRIAHRIIQPSTPAYKQIIACFGKGILAGKYISRKRLANIAFSNKKNLNKLNKIMHPKILRRIRERINKIPDSRILVIDAALLIEAGLLSRIDRLVVVKARQGVQMNRLRRSGRPGSQIKMRLSFQLPQDKKVSLADFLIDNSAGRSQTMKQVCDIWERLSETTPPLAGLNSPRHRRGSFKEG